MIGFELAEGFGADTAFLDVANFGIFDVGVDELAELLKLAGGGWCGFEFGKLLE